ncbi:hypothetical protein KIL84_021637 [Mauremys mutica]|uniref:Uncharacterized protein n=1 Tax=Mauremys mutica TaxID=74926 RepID=A0A9D3X9A4_9SAUR|nr:hypothetical protein KIL84_021637 [Mauremys mutica]
MQHRNVSIVSAACAPAPCCRNRRALRLAHTPRLCVSAVPRGCGHNPLARDAARLPHSRLRTQQISAGRESLQNSSSDPGQTSLASTMGTDGDRRVPSAAAWGKAAVRLEY